jgi:hypothetical protein
MKGNREATGASHAKRCFAGDRGKLVAGVALTRRSFGRRRSTRHARRSLGEGGTGLSEAGYNAALLLAESYGMK